MKLKEVNASSIKTKKAIKKAFAELVEEKKEIQNITVTELVKRIDMTRGSFYTHYDNIYEVAEEFQEELLETLFANDMVLNTKEDINNYLDMIFNYLSENESIYSKLLTSDDPLIFMNRLNKMICKELMKTVYGKNNELNVIFFVDATVSLIVKYFRKEIKTNINDIKEYIKYMVNLIFKIKD